MEMPRAIIIGISGCSSSGKTTLARLLRDIFPNTFILHEDDFYKPEEQLPVKNGLVDWDCIEAISVSDLERALEYIRSTGTFPPFVDSKQDQNSVGACPVPVSVVATQKARVSAWLQPGQAGARLVSADVCICLLDGFMLYTPALQPIMEALDVRLFLRASRARALRRREARDGYVTLDGFWRDPPGYVDRIVWPNYVAAHAWLFVDGDVEGELDGRKLLESGIKAQLGTGVDIDFGQTLGWAVGLVMTEVTSLLSRNGLATAFSDANQKQDDQE